MANKISCKRRRRKAITTSASSETSVSTSAEVIASNVDLLSEILLRLPPKSLIRFKKRVGYIVCNPTTQKFTPLPDHGDNPSPACLAFDPSQSPHHKVVLLHYIPSPQFAIYYSESKSWNPIIVDALPVTYLKGVFWNGAIHWLTDNYHVRFELGISENVIVICLLFILLWDSESFRWKVTPSVGL
ncbi:hypothetical protein TEA_026438 [Camellia sinensis var. sinensis]|uniref:F-box associated beta-propeller type 3 domain-containing protein n=1 Tax=Camellia sinensis var. sinensis TaxID=542762 RepID=A0A4S4D9P6_CAMSN|nr:hypothetical protein TEA_026438 [Camellia sinensis var. sinensis]